MTVCEIVIDLWLARFTKSTGLFTIDHKLHTNYKPVW